MQSYGIITSMPKLPSKLVYTIPYLQLLYLGRESKHGFILSSYNARCTIIQLKVYAARQEVLGFETTTDFIGFTLPSTSVTTSRIPIDSDVIMINLYSSILWLLYAVSTVMFLIIMVSS